MSGDIFWLNTAILRAINDAIFVHIYEAFSLHFIAQFTIGTHHREQNEMVPHDWANLPNSDRRLRNLGNFILKTVRFLFVALEQTRCSMMGYFGGWGMEHRRLKTSAPPALWELWKLNMDIFWMHTRTQCSQHVICFAKRETKTETIVETEIHLWTYKMNCSSLINTGGKAREIFLKSELVKYCRIFVKT